MRDYTTAGMLEIDAVRVVRGLPSAWKPAIESGKIVKSRYMLPLKFGLEE